jgi:hypothetical protein
MPRRSNSPTELLRRLQILAELLEAGQPLPAALEAAGVPRTTLQVWLSAPALSERPADTPVERLADENAQLRKLLAQLILEKLALEGNRERRGRRSGRRPPKGARRSDPPAD